MLSSIFENFFKSLSPSSISEIFFWLLTFIALSGIFSFLRSRQSSQSRLARFAEYSPVLLTSLGILGTFSGIVAGLLNFDIQQIDGSISSLLAGMKTAFLTSVFGVFLSVLLKSLYMIIGKAKNNVDKGLDIDELAKAIYIQAEENKQQTKHLANSYSTLQAISQKMADNQNTFTQFEAKLLNEMKGFADILSKSATETVVQALQKVISDFNSNLTEQFGQNFKELNSAVEKLVDWQNTYQEQLNTMIEQYRSGVQSLDSTKNSLISIETQTQSITSVMSQLEDVIKTNQTQVEQLDKNLENFSKLGSQAVENLPKLQEMLDKVAQVNINFNDQLDGLNEKLAQTVEENVNKQLTAIDEAMQKEIERVLQEMGSALATISGKFTADYTRLTTAMANIVRGQ